MKKVYKFKDCNAINLAVMLYKHTHPHVITDLKGQLEEIMRDKGYHFSDNTLWAEFLKSKNLLHELTEEVKPKKEMILGRWYKQNHGEDGYAYSLYRGLDRTCGINVFGQWIDNHSWHIKDDTKENWEEVSDSEIKKVLQQQVESKGFKKGVRVKSPWLKGSGVSKGILTGGYSIYRDTITMQSNHFSTYTVYKDGKWAEALPITLPQIESYSGKLIASELHYGCISFPIAYIEDLLNIGVKSFSIDVESHGEVEVTKKQFTQIVDYLKSKGKL